MRQSRITVDRPGRITGKKAGNDPADETGAQGARQQSADHPRREARTVGDGIGDIACQQRHHQLERAVATDLHQRRRQRALLLERGDAEHERQGDHQAAGHHHRQHEGHAGQQVFIDARLLLFGRCFGSARCAFLLTFGQGLFQRRFGLLEGNAGAAAIDFLAGETLGGDFDIGRQQHHIGLGNRLRAQWIARADRALGFHLQLIAQALGRLLQGFGGHERVSDTRRARGNGHQSRRVLDNRHRFDDGLFGGVNLSVLRSTAQHGFHVLQGLGRGALEHPLADKARHFHRRAGHQQHPLRRVEGGRRQLLFGMRGIGDFDTGAPALALGRGIEQPGTQHTGDHAVRAGRNDG
ncbi:hypothetical protein D3C72_1227010 [compost metagenome]